MKMFNKNLSILVLSLFSLCSLIPEKVFSTSNDSSTAVVKKIGGKKFRQMINKGKMSYEIMSAVLKENPERKNGSKGSMDVMSQVVAFSKIDNLLRFKKKIKNGIKNNTLTSVQQDLYQKQNLNWAIALCCEVMFKAGRLEMHVKMTSPKEGSVATEYIVIMGDKKVRPYKKIVNTDNEDADSDNEPE
jgi:hypothetical protein